MPEDLNLATSYINYIFTIYFVFEVIIRVIGVGPNVYFSEGLNWWVV